MTRNPVVLAGFGLALLAAPAWAQNYAAAPAAPAVPQAAAPVPPAAKVNTVRTDRIQEQHLADQQKTIAAERHKLALKQQDLAKQQSQIGTQRTQLAAEQRKLAAEQRRLAAEQRKLALARQPHVASSGKPVGCGTFLGKPRDPASCRAIQQQIVLNRLGPYDRVPVTPGS